MKTVEELEELFQSEDTLDSVLEECGEDFKKINYFADLLKKDVVSDNPKEARTAISKLTGIYMELKPVLALAETEKKNREIRYYDTKRMDMENEGKKFVSAPAEKEASVHVASYRRVRNIIQGYLDACDKAISSLQTIIKAQRKEDYLGTKGEE